MFFIFGQYCLKGSIKIDITLLSLLHVIRKNLISSRTYEEIKMYMDEQDEKKLVDSSIILFVFMYVFNYVVVDFMLLLLWELNYIIVEFDLKEEK